MAKDINGLWIICENCGKEIHGQGTRYCSVCRKLRLNKLHRRKVRKIGQLVNMFFPLNQVQR